MANTTIRTQIMVQFNDQFSEPAKQAVKNYKKSLEEIQRTGKATEGIFESISRQQVESIRFNEKFISDALEEFDKSMSKIESEFLKKTAIDRGSTIASYTALVVELHKVLLPVLSALAAIYVAWKAGNKLPEWKTDKGQPVERYVEGINQSLNELANREAPGLPPVPEETMRSLETTKSCLEQIQSMQDVFIRINLVDNATQEAKRIRDEIENTFSRDVTQRIKIVEETVSKVSSSGSRKFDSVFSDGLPDFQTPSKDLTGFDSSVTSSIPGFASGIERVPRDMLAVIHKDEAVLPKKQAEDYRRGGSSGITIQNLDFSFNVSSGLNLGREEFRNFAFRLRDELKRLDRRIN